MKIILLVVLFVVAASTAIDFSAVADTAIEVADIETTDAPGPVLWENCTNCKLAFNKLIHNFHIVSELGLILTFIESGVIFWLYNYYKL